MIRLGGQLALPVRAKGGKRKKFFALADYKESLVPEIGVHTVADIAAHRPNIDDSFWGGQPTSFDNLWV
jgi:hypothetical protein